MVASKAGWAKAAAKLALTIAISAFSMATTPAAAADPVSTARAAALRDCSFGCPTTTGVTRIEPDQLGSIIGFVDRSWVRSQCACGISC
jgi:hypothetical protein